MQPRAERALGRDPNCDGELRDRSRACLNGKGGSQVVHRGLKGLEKTFLARQSRVGLIRLPPPDGKPAVPDGRLKKPLRSGAGLSAEEKEKEGGAPTRQRWAARLLGRGREEKGPGGNWAGWLRGSSPLFFISFLFKSFPKEF